MTGFSYLRGSIEFAAAIFGANGRGFCYLVVALGVLAAFGPPAQATFSHYVLTDLAALQSGMSSYAYGLNSSGQVVGESLILSGGQYVQHAFLYSGGTMQDIGTLGGNNSCAYGINDAGQIVGSSDTGTTSHAFLYTSGTMSDLGDMCGGTGTNAAYGINNAGQVVGSAATIVQYHGTNCFPNHAFLYTTGGGMQDLGTLPWDDSLPGPPQSVAYAINNNGLMVGSSDTLFQCGSIKYETQHAFVCAGGTMQDLNTLYDQMTLMGPPASVANAVNYGGQIVGWSSANSSGDLHAFLLDGQGMHDLGGGGPLLGWPEYAANGINVAGQIVGHVGDGGPPWQGAFVYADGEAAYLNSLIKSDAGWSLTDATAINDSGQIVGAMVQTTGGAIVHGYELTPAIPGDANLDGSVNGADMNIVLSNFNQTGMSWEQGDFDGNGTVNGSDLLTVLSNYGQHLGVSAAVPEPSEIVLLAGVIAAFLAGVRRRRR